MLAAQASVAGLQEPARPTPALNAAAQVAWLRDMLTQRRCITSETILRAPKAALKLCMSPAPAWQRRHSGDKPCSLALGTAPRIDTVDCCRTHHTEASSGSSLKARSRFAQAVGLLDAGTHRKLVARRYPLLLGRAGMCSLALGLSEIPSSASDAK